jgi:hypothetical protein
MTTPDIAGLCERLREEARKLRTQKERGPAFHFPWGQDIIDANNATAAAFEASADTLERQAAENKRLREALRQLTENAVCARGCGLKDDEDGIVSSALFDTIMQARAALTGEDTAGSPTSQNTEPGLAFSDAGEP